MSAECNDCGMDLVSRVDSRGKLTGESYCIVCEQAAEIERLRAQLADSISRETVIATEMERDEARDAARRLLSITYGYGCEYLTLQSVCTRWPWIRGECNE